MKAHRWYAPWVLVAPALLWLFVFTIWPSLNTIRLSFTNAKPLGGSFSWVGGANFTRLLDDPQLGRALFNSLFFMVVCLPLLTLLPLLLAVLVEKPLRGIAFFRVAYYTPVIASAVVVGLIWTWLLNDRGIFNTILQSMRVISEPLPFLTERWLIILSAVAVTVWKGLGYYMIIYLAALGNIGKDLHEAASMDGANAVRRFFAVTVPGVRSTMTLIAMLICVAALRVFSEIYVLTGGTGGAGGEAMTLVMLIQRYSGGFEGNLGYAAALSIVLFLVTLVPMGAIAIYNRRQDS
ncbi:carbohydrate ABC transporter membrane protein 1 (CUT1 family) [Salana multivorans]|uniref:Carbohydrate ABC transporter membrane protein 1 (CUT1 family) n=1 Tax=Salana multivorans TaxID=120377 RepID=A0A3N2D8W7_9MICO|nr:sugar ABC transporter permease [Salana multivorans]ROR96152.1 carbohydrate ABC transporter membrane protein 1 (CUT1 family) [Salana multivorans]